MYIRHDENNNPISPQPGFTTVTQFNGTEGWSSVEYQDWNADYTRHDETNSPISVGVYQRHNENNQTVGIGTYQRYDENNNPVSL